MDQNTGGADKRNWRERLGIGTKEMPKIAEDFKAPPAATAEAQKSAGVPKPSAHVPVKAAPMAPRVAAKPATVPTAAFKPAPAPQPRPAAVAPDALANKLKTQREAAEKLAVQRVQAAKQKAEAALAASTQSAPAKPKFSFAEEEAKVQSVAPLPRPQPQPPRPAMPPAAQGFPGQVQPPRPQLGVNPGYVMPPTAPSSYGNGPQPQSYPPQFQQPSFGMQPPAYRPIDPATGYSQPPNYRPQFQPSSTGSPSARLQPPPRPITTGGAGPRLGTAQPRSDVEDDVFEQAPARPARRATANEYQQAYRDEMGFDEEPPRSNGLLMLLTLGLLLLGLTIAAVYGYSKWWKPQFASVGAGGTNVPVVAAPQTPAKTTPEQTTAGTQTDQAAINKKLIYDRIEGDHEVLGGQIKSTEEPPALPAAGAPPAPATNTTNGTGSDGIPLPLPPPPGDGNGQQGALQPSDKSDIANITPAAEPSSAANSSAVPAAVSDPSVRSPSAVAQSAGSLPVPEAAPGVTQQTAIAEPAVPPSQPSQAPTPDTPSQVAETTPQKDQIVDTEQKPAETPKAVVPKPKKVASAKSLGAKPLVLVPPKKAASSSESTKPQIDVAASQATNGGLYGDVPVGDEAAIAEPQPRKNRSIFDLFKSNKDQSTAVAAPTATSTTTPAKPTQIAAANPTVAPAAPSGTGAFVVQLASFRSRGEAQAEYQRLGQKHGAIITRYAPIIETAQVAGSTRYRLNLGPMASSSVASSVCSSLFAAGERDCLVHRQ